MIIFVFEKKFLFFFWVFIILLFVFVEVGMFFGWLEGGGVGVMKLIEIIKCRKVLFLMKFEFVVLIVKV